MLAEIEATAPASEGDNERGAFETNQARIFAARGQLEAARTAVAEAVRISAATTNPTHVAYSQLFNPAWLALCEGRYSDAHTGTMASAAHSWELLEESTIVGGMSAAILGDATSVTEAIRLFTAGGLANLHGEAILGTLEASRLALEGRIPEAGLLYSSAAEKHRRLGTIVELALMAIVRAKLIRPHDAATMAAISEAREILTGLRAASLLKLLEDAAAGGSAVWAPGKTGSPSVEPSSASRTGS